jgi:small-conductance mechanosensitive channel/CRP-like cAMP-binding protein
VAPTPKRALWSTAALLFSGLFCFLFPAALWAVPSAEPPRTLLDRFSFSHVGVLVLIAGTALVAALVQRYAPKKRVHVRRTVILLLVYITTLGLGAVLGHYDKTSAADTVRTISDLLATFTVINLGTIAIFDLILPALAIETTTIVIDLVTGLGYVVVFLAAARRWGLDFSSVLATSAVVTAILAFSLQATLGNILGGVALQIDKSIRVGDWIQLEPNGRQGRVREIRWRHTVLETRDWDTLIIPNATLLAANILILGKRESEPCQRRMNIHFNVDFRYNPVDVVAAVEAAFSGSLPEGVASDPAPNCVCLDFANTGRDSFSYYSLRYWLVDLSRDDMVSSRVRARLFAALKRANIPLAVPAAQLFVENDDSERRERKRRRELERRLQALRSVGFLQPLTEEELVNVANALKYAPFAPGETVSKQGAVAHFLYILAEGAVEVRVSVEGSEPRMVHTLHAPTFFGEMGLMTGEPRNATVVAVSDIECYRLDKMAFKKILAERPLIASEISSILAERRLEIEEAIGDVESRKMRVHLERNRILSTIRGFFGLGEEAPESER